ncbi:MAG: hypothetical protein KDD38_09240 [Bdellovibrionales bacterium]|nr:hypothetical protein [Bdellovibrionales bacterium]
MFLTRIALIFVFGVVFCPPALARTEVRFTHSVTGDSVAVYSKPSESSSIIYRLSLGEQVAISSKNRGQFKAVLFKASGRFQKGYVLESETNKWGLISPIVAEIPRKRFSIYASVIESFGWQGKRDLQTASDAIYSVGTFSGFSTFFAAGVDMPYGEEWAVRLGVVMRRSYLEGVTQPENSATEYKFGLEQDFIGASAGLRLRPKSWGAWSLMGGAEFSKGTSVDLKVLKGPSVNTSEVQLPYFMIFSGALLYEKLLSKDFAFEPALRLGVVATAEPVILIAEGLLTIKYYF